MNTKLRWMDSLARETGRTLRYGIRLHVITRDTADEAWRQASRLIEGVGDDVIAHGAGRTRPQRVRGAAPDA